MRKLVTEYERQERLQELYNRKMSQEAKVGMKEAIFDPSLLYGSEVWMPNVYGRNRMETAEINCLSNICGERRLDRVRNEEIQ